MPHKQRLEKLKKCILGYDALLITDPTNLFYLTGLELSTGKVLCTKESSYLIVDGRYKEVAGRQTEYQVELEKETLLPHLLQHAKRVAFCKETTSFKAYEDLKKLLSSTELVAVEDPVMALRLIKDPEELSLMRQAAHLGSEGFDYVYDMLEEGISEKEVATELELFWRRQGGSGVAFEPIIAFGANGSMPHYRAGDALLRAGQSVLIDIGVTREHYHSDMTRVVFFGPPNPEMTHIYDVTLRAQQAALALCRSGVTAGELDDAARAVMRDAGLADAFSHGLGHGIGLEVHEPPFLSRPIFKDKVLEAGMVITIEPGIYLPGKGGVRLEDTVVITPTGYEDLTLRDKAIRII